MRYVVELNLLIVELLDQLWSYPTNPRLSVFVLFEQKAIPPLFLKKVWVLFSVRVVEASPDNLLKN